MDKATFIKEVQKMYPDCLQNNGCMYIEFEPHYYMHLSSKSCFPRFYVKDQETGATIGCGFHMESALIMIKDEFKKTQQN